MYQVPQITDSVYYVGVNDRMKERFEKRLVDPLGRGLQTPTSS